MPLPVIVVPLEAVAVMFPRKPSDTAALYGMWPSLKATMSESPPTVAGRLVVARLPEKLLVATS